MTDKMHTAEARARDSALAPGLYLVATPIGAARDITLRALDILASADVLAAEDTRTLRHLMEIHGIKPGDRPLWAYHDHNGAAVRPRILEALAQGRSVAYCSEAGTPVVADPGYQLARAAIEAGATVTGAPGPSAAILALSLSGLPSDRFLFAGFPPAQAGARARWLDEIGAVEATLILYESPKRIQRLLTELCERWSEGRKAALCRELTKRFEEVRRGTLGTLRDGLADAPVKGEIVLVVGHPVAVAPSQADVDGALVAALGRLRVKEAAAEVAEALGLPRREVYQRALALKREGDG
ncbi:MAG: 16S rRNA (cytidine(1402)-2'-O)-methyltransferase [Roseicyclus sp.]|jgi:16S rRNA (cytidine1402-2'-O)-methyltransferase|nr:16S rRNA (cytidine(1402)-2'-O)-methyltransferase [Roseicyclus sp.]